MTTEAEAARSLMSATAVRERCRMLYEAGLADKLTHFHVQRDMLDACAAYVAETVRMNYPDLRVPFHSRWRHFTLDGVDFYDDAIDQGLISTDPQQRARQRFELAITSVLLDAGAGSKWRWPQWSPKLGKVHRVGRSEGLALASLTAFTSGLFSSDVSDPARADADGLGRLTASELGDAFHVSADNPLEGLDGRAALLNRLGAAIRSRPDLFGPDGRLGGVYDALRAKWGQLPFSKSLAEGLHSQTKMVTVPILPIPVPSILALLLEALGPIWPGRIELGGVSLGDTWRHLAITVSGPTAGLVPFHKLSQWLAYSLIEPLQEAGHTVADIDGLTGLAEYRNGGLFVDMGVLVPKHPELLSRRWSPSDEPIVEWRALTVTLLDEIAALVRARLGRTPQQMPLASVLEGGTWSAGRRIAREKRADGGPPISIVSDGSVF